MIDDKKIEKAAFDYNDGELTSDKLIRAAFIYSAKWAINEFLKDLWRPVSEEPVKDKPFLTQWKDKWLVDVDSSKFLDNNWNRHCEIQGIKRWLYVEDLLPKTKTQKGDEQ